MALQHIIEIKYCTQCNWMLRATWVAQELMTTFLQDLESVKLTLGTGGVFDILVDDQLILSRKELGRFPDIKEIKKAVRDKIDPERDLGHTDRA